MSERSERDTIRGVQIRAGAVYVNIYICMEVRMPHATYTYVIWAELGHCHFLYVPAVLNIVTTGNGTGTKNVLKWNLSLSLVSSLLSMALLL